MLWTVLASYAQANQNPRQFPFASWHAFDVSQLFGNSSTAVVGPSLEFASMFVA